jgi:hypothetical protein
MREIIVSKLEETGLVLFTPQLSNVKTVLCPTHCLCHKGEYGFDTFPMDEFGVRAVFIRSLQLEKNNLRELPHDFFAFFPYLVDIDLADNQLHSLPLGIAHCTMLESIRFDNALDWIRRLAGEESFILSILRNNNVTC